MCSFFFVFCFLILLGHTRTMPLGTILEMSMYSLISAHISLYCILSPPGGISSSYWCSEALLHNLCPLFTFNWFSKLQPANTGFWNRHILLKWRDVRDITDDLTCYNMCKHTCWGKVTHNPNHLCVWLPENETQQLSQQNNSGRGQVLCTCSLCHTLHYFIWKFFSLKTLSW